MVAGLPEGTGEELVKFKLDATTLDKLGSRTP